MSSNYPKTWHQVAVERGVEVAEDGSVNGGAYAAVGVAILNGCPDCGATVAPYNSYQINPLSPWAFCRDCAGVEEVAA